MTMTKPTSEQVTFLAAGAGATLRNLVDKVRESVSAADFGAVGDGVTNDTAALKAAFDYAMPLKMPVVLRGTYLVNGPVTSLITRASGELHIICDGNVVINVDPATASSFALFYLVVTPASANASITGGSLTIDCANRLPNCFYIWHLNTTSSGTIAITCPVTVLNCKQNGSSGDAMALAIFGQWQRIEINDFTAIGVSRTASGGTCRGINASVGATGECTIRRPFIKNVLLPSPSDGNADGLGVQGTPAAGDAFNDNRLGRFVIDGGTFIDCQGAAIKSQCSDTTVIAPLIQRQYYVSFANGHDLDFQFGGGKVISPVFEYRKNAGVSPLNTAFSSVKFQHRTPQFETTSFVTNATVISEVPFRRFCGSFYFATQKSCAVTIDGLTLIPVSGYAGPIIDREILVIPDVESTIVAMSAKADVIVRNVYGPMDAAGIAYSAYLGGSIASKLAVEVSNVRNTLGFGTWTSAFRQLDAQPITALDWFILRDNAGISNFLGTTGANGLYDVDFSKLAVGTQFVLALNFLGTITNGPPWTAGDGSAIVEVIASGLAAVGTGKIIRVTTFSGASADRAKVFVSLDNAATWREQGACAPVTKTADFTVAASEDVLINNKSGSTCVVTLPAPASWRGRRILIKTIQAQAVDSASSNVVPLAGGAAGTSILTNTAGKYADIVSDGTNWVIMAAN